MSTQEGLAIVQIGLNTSDMPATLRLYSEAFGFHNAGANAFWGAPSAIQGLGPTTRGMMWWLVGRQPFFQLEVFQHTLPKPRPLPADWRPSDHGWVRFGIRVPDIARARAVLDEWQIELVGEREDREGQKRIVFRDPFVGVFVELIEDGSTSSDGDAASKGEQDPALAYATCSVSDLAGARHFYESVLGLEIRSREALHQPEDEALWGLGGAEAEGFLACSADMCLEIVAYRVPLGRPQPDDHCSADQGIMNVALGSRDVGLVREIAKRVEFEGIRTGQTFGEGDMLALFLLAPDRQVELIALPEAMDAAVGFAPAVPFFGTWA